MKPASSVILSESFTAEAARQAATPIDSVTLASEAVAAAVGGRQWSPYQEAIFDWVESPRAQHLIVEALAGSGKTTTIVEALKCTPESDSVAFMAFSKEIAETLKARAPEGVAVSTCHSYGNRQIFRAMKKRPVDQYCVAKRLKSRGEKWAPWAARDARDATAKLISVAKACLAWDRDELLELMYQFDIQAPQGWEDNELITAAIADLEFAADASDGPIDFDDMIWLPVVRDLRCQQFDWVFVDETQDLNACQLELIQMAAGDRGRIVAVGDRRQSIYAFRGADAQAIPRMIEELKADVLPLSITYRCAAAITREAQRYVPEIECPPTAPEGVVRDGTTAETMSSAAPGDFVLSRTNAPLVKCAYALLRQGRRALIRGRAIGEELAAWLEKFGAGSIPELIKCVTTWRDAEVRRLEALDRPTDGVFEKAELVFELCEGRSSVGDLVAMIERLFSDATPENSILLSSTHRAKGLEADRVWLLSETYHPERSIEEKNLLYVAITRAKKELVYV